MLVQLNTFLLLGLLKVNITRSGKHSLNPLALEKNSRLTSLRSYYPRNVLFKFITLETHRQSKHSDSNEHYTSWFYCLFGKGYLGDIKQKGKGDKGHAAGYKNKLTDIK